MSGAGIVASERIREREGGGGASDHGGQVGLVWAAGGSQATVSALQRGSMIQLKERQDRGPWWGAREVRGACPSPPVTRNECASKNPARLPSIPRLQTCHCTACAADLVRLPRAATAAQVRDLLMGAPTGVGLAQGRVESPRIQESIRNTCMYRL